MAIGLQNSPPYGIALRLRSHKDVANMSNPTQLPSILQKLRIGDIIRRLPTTLRAKKPVAVPGVAGTYIGIKLPDDAKAGRILAAYARAGTAGTGRMVISLDETPATGEIAISNTGDLIFLAADAITSVDVIYLPENADAWEIELPVASNVAILPPELTSRAVVLVAEASGNGSAKTVMLPGATPIAGQCALSVDKTTVVFAGADSVTSCKLKILTGSDFDLDAALESISTIG